MSRSTSRLRFLDHALLTVVAMACAHTSQEPPALQAHPVPEPLHSVVASAVPVPPAKPEAPPPVALKTVVPLEEKSGCVFRGEFAGPIKLTTDPSSERAQFGELFASEGEVAFGSNGDSIARATLHLRGYEIALMLKAVDVALFPRTRIAYRQVFVPEPTEPLHALPDAKGTMQLAPNGWGEAGAVFAKTPYWQVRCTELQPATGSYALPVPTSIGAFSGATGPISLSEAPRGPVVVTLRPGSPLEVMSIRAGIAYGAFHAQEGLYRGFVPLAKIVESGASLGRYARMYRGPTATISACTEPVFLYVVRRAEKAAYRVGHVPPSVGIGYDGAAPIVEVTGSSVDGAGEMPKLRLKPLAQTASLKLNSGDTLAVAVSPEGSCRARELAATQP